MKSKVLILGGTGVTGRLILKELLHLPLDLTVGSRQAPASHGMDANVQHLAIDIREEQDAVEKLAHYDVVIIATGPFKTYGNLPHLLCIKAGVHCIDVNDEVEAAVAVYDLHKVADEKGVCVLTGMGLNPGLMTFMLLRVMEQAGAGAKNAWLQLFIGGRQDAGYAAVQVMLEGFTPEVAVIRDGNFASIKAADKAPWLACHFPGMEAPVPAVHCATTQAYTFTRNPAFRELRNLDFRIHFQGITLWMVRFLRKNKWVKKERIRNWLADIIYRSQDKMKRRKGNVTASIAWVRCESPQRTAEACCTGMTSYEMTAKFAATITELFIDGKLLRQPGVKGIEDHIVEQDVLQALLGNKGIHISYTGR